MPIFDVSSCEDFDPDGVPTLASLAKELNDYKDGVEKQDIDQGEQVVKKPKVEDYLKTSLKIYIEDFERLFLRKLKDSQRKDAREASQRRQNVEDSKKDEVSKVTPVKQRRPQAVAPGPLGDAMDISW